MSTGRLWIGTSTRSWICARGHEWSSYTWFRNLKFNVLRS